MKVNQTQICIYIKNKLKLNLAPMLNNGQNSIKIRKNPKYVQRLIRNSERGELILSHYFSLIGEKANTQQTEFIGCYDTVRYRKRSLVSTN